MRDHEQMIQEKGLQHGSLYEYPEKRAIFNVLQVWVLLHVIFVVEALNYEKDILTNENEQVCELSTYGLSYSLLIRSSDFEYSDKRVVLEKGEYNLGYNLLYSACKNELFTETYSMPCQEFSGTLIVRDTNITINVARGRRCREYVDKDLHGDYDAFLSFHYLWLTSLKSL